MAELLPVPEIAAGTTEVLLSEWAVEPGEAIAAGDVVAVVETDKAMVEIEAALDAVVLRHLAAAGTSIAVGAPLALLGSREEVGTDLDALLADLGVGVSRATPAPERREVPEAAPAPSPPRRVSSPTDVAPAQAAQPPAYGSDVGSLRRFMSPIARKLLAEAGLTSDDIVGTGPGGRIRRRDVEPGIEAARRSRDAQGVDAATPESVATQAATHGWTDVPHSRLRRVIAQRLTESKQQVPHFYLRRSARMDNLLALRADVNAQLPRKISLNDFLIRAVALAHQEVPDANVIWTDEAIRHFDTVDISVAIASERGLVTPVLRSVEQLRLPAISAEVTRFVELAGAGRLQQRDLEGGSITISNLGMYGVDEFAAIINPPQATILAVGAVCSRPVVVTGAVVPVTAINLVLSVDHRAVDGTLAAHWLATLVGALENPLRLVV